MDLRIEIVGDQVVCFQDGASAFAAPLKDVVCALGERSGVPAFPEAIPEGVRFVRRRGDGVVLVLEERPQVRTVQWLTDDSSEPFGKGAVYRTARLAFPFVVAAIAFRGGRLTGMQECFYRTEPLAQLSDPLLLPNLYNVANGYGQTCWLCLANLRSDLRPLSWNEKVRELRRHLWGAGFNRSSEMHEGMSYWSAMRTIDRRFKTVDAWEKASREDPYFTLQVNWRPAERTIGDVIDGMMTRLSPPPPETAAHLTQVLSTIVARNKRAGGSPSANEAR